VRGKNEPHRSIGQGVAREKKEDGNQNLRALGTKVGILSIC